MRLSDEGNPGIRSILVYSSRTGNTEKLARGVYAILTGVDSAGDQEGGNGLSSEARGAGNRSLFTLDLASITEAPDPEKHDTIILAFWVNRGYPDEASLAYLKRIEKKRIGFLATLGAYPDSDHAEKVKNRVKDLILERNEFLGSFFCQGKLDPKLTKKFTSLPPDHPHAMTPERAKRHRDAASHPDENDIVEAASVCRDMLSLEG